MRVARSRAAPVRRLVETFNSDAGLYGGSGVGNHGATIPSAGGEIVLRLPANGLVVLQRA